MVTTRRSEELTETSRSTSAVDLLERKAPDISEEYTNAPEREENLEEAKIRMQKNLDKLLNYDRYSEATEDVGVADVVDAPSEERAESVVYSEPDENIVSASEMGADVISDDDIRPTSTTMQFGEGNAEPVLNDMAKQKEEQHESYRLNAKGKFVVALYAVAVALILTLIVLNTGVLAVLSRSNSEYSAALSAKIEEYNAVVKEIDSASSVDYIIDVAEKEFGMIK